MIDEGGSGQGSGGAYGIVENKSFVYDSFVFPNYYSWDNSAFKIETGNTCFEKFTAGPNQPIEFYSNFTYRDTDIRDGYEITFNLYRDDDIVARSENSWKVEYTSLYGTLNVTLLYKGVETEAANYQFCIRDDTVDDIGRYLDIHTWTWGYKIFEEGYPLDVVRN